jgi:hypothetical protein
MFPTGVRDELKRFVAGLEPGVYDAEAAKRLVGVFAELERLAAAGKALMARRVQQTGAWKGSGERSAAHWLARQTGSSVGEAAGTLAVAEKLDALPGTDEALRAGRLSGTQARYVAEGAAGDPTVEADLVAVAERESVGELRNEVRRHRASREDERARYARIHARRFFRHRVDTDGAFTGEFCLTPDAGAEVLAAFSSFRDRSFRQARSAGRREPLEAYAADGLVEMARWVRANGRAPDRRAGPTRDRAEPVASVRPGRDVKIIVRVDAPALLRGRTEPGEVCEIAGVGPVPVAVVYSMLPEALATAVITKADAVASVAHAGRAVTATQLTALQWQGIQCEVDGCEMREFLEIDHLVDYAITAHTKLDELGFKCRHHHDLKTYQGWDFVPDTKHLVPPDHPHHPGPMTNRTRAGPPPASGNDQPAQLPLGA